MNLPKSFSGKGKDKKDSGGGLAPSSKTEESLLRTLWQAKVPVKLGFTNF
jgi:hypothetical protein